MTLSTSLRIHLFSGLSAAVDDVRKQAQAALDIEMSNLAKTNLWPQVVEHQPF